MIPEAPLVISYRLLVDQVTWYSSGYRDGQPQPLPVLPNTGNGYNTAGPVPASSYSTTCYAKSHEYARSVIVYAFASTHTHPSQSLPFTLVVPFLVRLPKLLITLPHFSYLLPYSPRIYPASTPLPQPYPSHPASTHPSALTLTSRGSDTGQVADHWLVSALRAAPAALQSRCSIC